MMLEKMLIDTITIILKDMKAQNIIFIDVSKYNYITNNIVICTANSLIHTNAIANQVSKTIKKLGGKYFKLEGQDYKEWIIVDLGEVILHIMLEKIREYYNLENMWLKKEN